MLSAVYAECCVFIVMLSVVEHQEDKQKCFFFLKKSFKINNRRDLLIQY